MKRLLIAIALVSVCTPASAAWEKSYETSAYIALLNGAEIRAATTYPIADGQHAIVTFWQVKTEIYRCFAILTDKMATGKEVCDVAR